MVKPKWRPLIHSLPCVNCHLMEPSLVVMRRYTNTPYIPQGTSHFLYLDVSTLSRGTSLPNSLWTVFIYAGYSLSLRLMWSCLVKRGRWGWRCSPSPKRFCGRVQRGTLPFCPNSTVDPFVGPSSTSRRGHPDGGRIRLSPNPQASTRHQLSQSSAGMWVGPGDTGVGSKIWQ